jgi:Lrp/AsnC family transcriptional regulator, leucine-responsive regulatory protein
MPNIVKLDEYDKKLLYELDRDAHTSLTMLAKRLKKSKQFIDYRIKKLEENKIIIRYHAIIDASRLGFTTYRIYLKFQQTLKSDEEEIYAFLEKFDNIWTIAKLHGKWDVAFFVGTKIIKDLHDVWDDLLDKFKDKIKDYSIAVYAPIINFNRTFFTDKNPEIIERIYGDGQKIDYDDIDMEIIKIYSNNVRMSYLEIAKKLKLSINTIIKRIKTLEKNKVICGYKLDINLEPLGYVGYRIDLHLSSAKSKTKLIEFCRQNKNIYQIMNTVGGADFEMSVIVKDFYEILKLMETMKNEFKGIINDYDYFGYTTFPKLSMVPD